ncbi:coiled-coil domain-containing protein 154-like isoform X2 [Symsagittifera roscoffensis]|uniref:coiled-coil domain-containing protein 154-like isoform X2 n=1 Tax=Symsagittifera roscoffensis TaxID=84072 RepID=UPI00307B97E8
MGGKFGQSGGQMMEDSNRVRALEMRLMAAEQSNKTVLEEVVRLQNEMRVTVRRLEENYSKELAERSQVDQGVRSASQSVQQMASRIQQIEQMMEQGQSSVTNLTGQVKRIETNLMSAQRDVLQRNDSYFARLNTVSQSVEEWAGERAKMQSVVGMLAQEVKQLKHALEVKQLDYQTLQQEIHKRSSQIENESQSMVDYFRKTQDHQSDAEYQQQQLRSNIESRLLEVRDSLVDLRNRFMKEESERRNTEQAFTKRLSEEHTQIADQSRQMDDLRHELARLSSSTNQAFDRERVEFGERVMKSEEDQKRKLYALEVALKNDLLGRISEFEKMYQSEKEHRHASEKVLRDESHGALSEMQKKMDAEIGELKKKIKADKAKLSGGYSELNKSAELIDRRHGESFEKLSRLLKAEISSRESQDQAVSNKTDELNHKLGIAIKTMQTSIGSVETKYRDLKESYTRDVDDLKTEVQLSITRSLGDLDVRVGTLTTRLKDLKTTTDSKLTEFENDQADKSARSTQQMALWHEQISTRVTDCQEGYSKLKPMITELQAQMGNFRLEANSRFDQEQQSRIDEMHQLREKLTHFPSRFRVDQLEESLNHQRDDLDLALAECQRIGEGFVGLQQNTDTRLSDETTVRTQQLTELREKLKRLQKLVDTYHPPANGAEQQLAKPNNNPHLPSQNDPNTPDAPKIMSPQSSNPDPERWQDANAN